jgi:biopolymer transport protein TolR
MHEINVVPYIDVMLVLLVIFMVTAPLLAQGIKVDLPQAASEPLPPDSREPLIVSVDGAGNYYLSVGEGADQPIGAEVLVTRVAAVLQYQPGTQVLVKGDRSVDYGSVVGAMALLQRAGAPSIGLITEAPPVAAQR